jgi:hypothetical protein
MYYIRYSVTNSFPEPIGQIALVLSNNKALGGYNISSCVISMVESAVLFIFALSIFCYHRVIGREITESKVSMREI